MKNDLENQLIEIYLELENFTQTSKFLRELFCINVIPGSKTTAEELKLINILMKYDASILTLVANEIEYKCKRYEYDIKPLNYIGILPLITIFGLIGVFLLRSSHEFSTQTVTGLWIMFILLGAFFLRKIFVLPSIFKAKRYLFIIKQAIVLKKI